MNTYEQRQADKKARYEQYAENAKARSNEAYKRADLSEDVSGIPMGQPILVGHHSEGRHRAMIKRAHAAMDKCVTEQKKAEYYAQKAANIGTGGISSDDPEAIAKLTEKLEELQQLQDFMKRANKIIRPAYKAGVRDPESGGWADYVKALRAIPHGEKYTDEAAANALVPDWGTRVGFAPFQLTNNNAKIKSTKARLAALEAKQGKKTRETIIGDICKVIENQEENRVQFIFEGKPSAEIRTIMKSRAFRWSPRNGAWQRQLTNAGIYAAERAIAELKAL